MALTKKAHTVRLLNFEEELLTQLSEQTGQTEEEMLLTYIRTGLKREKLEGLKSYKQREKDASDALYRERVQTLYRPTKAEKNKQPYRNSPEDNDQGDTEERSPSSNFETDLAQRFVELATLFDLTTPVPEQVMAEQHYLLKGQKELRIVVIKQVQTNGTVQYQVSGDESEKIHSFAFKRFAENARGAISEAQVEKLQTHLQD
jgi:hypothetical protein